MWTWTWVPYFDRDMGIDAPILKYLHTKTWLYLSIFKIHVIYLK